MKRKIIWLTCLCCLAYTIPTYASNIDWDKIEDEANEKSDNSTVLTSGDFYDYVSSLCPDAIITDYHDGTVSVDLTDSKIENFYSDSFNFLWVACRILGTQKFLPDYEEISFSYMEDDAIASLRIYDYVGIDDFTSSLMCFSTSNESVPSAIKSSYDKVFHNFDKKLKSDQAYDAIAEKYGISYESKSQTQVNDYWWLMSSYDPNIIFSFKNNKAVINYNHGLSDTYDDGYKVFGEIRDSSARYRAVRNIPGGLSFNTIDVVCFDGDSTKHLFDFNTSFQSDETWKNSVVTFNGDNFKEGAVAASDEQS